MTITAIILAAGKSTRMGRPKMLMPWGSTTVLGNVVQTVHAAGMDDIVVVTNSALAERLSFSMARIALNDNGEMLASIQAGLQVQSPQAEAALICLGDQPQIEERSVRSVCEAFRRTGSAIVVPSFQMRRGHPWLVARGVWTEILQMREPATMRDYLHAHHDNIFHVESDTPSILQDVDTPGDYLKYKPPL